MGRQSSRLYFQGKDHKDIYYKGHYHDKMYLGSSLVWEKIKHLFGYKLYAKVPFTFPYAYGDLFVAESEETVIFIAAISSTTVYKTNDFENIEEVLHATEKVKPTGTVTNCFRNVYFANGYFFVTTEYGPFYRSTDAINWEEVDTFYFDTNGFKGSILLGNGVSYDQYTLSVYNDTAFYTTGRARTDEYKENFKVGKYCNDYPHLIEGVYKSKDFVNWESVNTMFFEHTDDGKKYMFPLGIFWPFMRFEQSAYKDGYYYSGGYSIANTGGNYSEADESRVYGTYKTKDFKSFEMLLDEWQSVRNFGDYFIVGNLRLTKNFVDYISVSDFCRDFEYQTNTEYFSDRYNYKFWCQDRAISRLDYEDYKCTNDYIFIRNNGSATVFFESSNWEGTEKWDSVDVIYVVKIGDERKVIDSFFAFYPRHDFLTKDKIDDEVSVLRGGGTAVITKKNIFALCSAHLLPGLGAPSTESQTIDTMLILKEE